MNSNVKSQVDHIMASYLGKHLMILVPSQSLQEGIDAALKGNHRDINTREGLPYSYTTGRDWNRHRIHGLAGDEAFGMELICWSPDRLRGLASGGSVVCTKTWCSTALVCFLKGGS
jgi:hypothetical protein